MACPYLKKQFNVKLFLFPDMIFVTVHEFINPSCCVNKFHFTGIERMRCIRNLKLDKRIFVPIFPFNVLS